MARTSTQEDVVNFINDQNNLGSNVKVSIIDDSIWLDTEDIEMGMALRMVFSSKEEAKSVFVNVAEMFRDSIIDIQAAEPSVSLEQEVKFENLTSFTLEGVPMDHRGAPMLTDEQLFSNVKPVKNINDIFVDMFAPFFIYVAVPEERITIQSLLKIAQAVSVTIDDDINNIDLTFLLRSDVEVPYIIACTANQIDTIKEDINEFINLFCNPDENGKMRRLCTEEELEDAYCYTFHPTFLMIANEDGQEMAYGQIHVPEAYL